MSDQIIPSIDLESIVDSNIQLVLAETEPVNGNITLAELNILCQLVKQYNPQNIFEIGTFDGRTTINMAINSSDQSQIYTLDLPKESLHTTKFPLYPGDATVPSDNLYIDKQDIGSRYKGKQTGEKITQLVGDSATFDFSPYNNKMDFVFVDGSHAKDYVRNDTEVAFKLLRDNHGIILWHDYGVWQDVTNVLNNYYENDHKFKEVHQIKDTCFVVLQNN